MEENVKTELAAGKTEDGRDFQSEVDELMAVFPETEGKELPDEVLNDSVRSGHSLVRAYADFREKQNREALEALRSEKEALLSGGHAPVRAVSPGGSVKNAPSDPFLAGLNSY